MLANAGVHLYRAHGLTGDARLGPAQSKVTPTARNKLPCFLLPLLSVKAPGDTLCLLKGTYHPFCPCFSSPKCPSTPGWVVLRFIVPSPLLSFPPSPGQV